MKYGKRDVFFKFEPENGVLKMFGRFLKEPKERVLVVADKDKILVSGESTGKIPSDHYLNNLGQEAPYFSEIGAPEIQEYLKLLERSGYPIKQWSNKFNLSFPLLGQLMYARSRGNGVIETLLMNNISAFITKRCYEAKYKKWAKWVLGQGRSPIYASWYGHDDAVRQYVGNVQLKMWRLVTRHPEVPRDAWHDSIIRDGAWENNPERPGPKDWKVVNRRWPGCWRSWCDWFRTAVDAGELRDPMDPFWRYKRDWAEQHERQIEERQMRLQQLEVEKEAKRLVNLEKYYSKLEKFTYQKGDLEIKFSNDPEEWKRHSKALVQCCWMCGYMNLKDTRTAFIYRNGVSEASVEVDWRTGNVKQLHAKDNKGVTADVRKLVNEWIDLMWHGRE